MDLHRVIREIRISNDSKIVLAVIEGLGGLPLEVGGKTELESANTPNLNAMAREGICGLCIPVLPGLSPGTASGFLGLLGYDPLDHAMLDALGQNQTIDSFQDTYGLRSACIAVRSEYNSLAQLIGMDVIDSGAIWSQQIEALKRAWNRYDFFLLHYKTSEDTANDGNFGAKVDKIEKFDAEIPRIRALNPDVLIVTGDKSVPSKLRIATWHSVPCVLVAKSVRPDSVIEFGESSCLLGGLGQFQAKYLLGLALAHAGRMSKYGT